MRSPHRSALHYVQVKANEIRHEDGSVLAFYLMPLWKQKITRLIFVDFLIAKMK